MRYDANTQTYTLPLFIRKSEIEIQITNEEIDWCIGFEEVMNLVRIKLMDQLDQLYLIPNDVLRGLQRRYHTGK